jgi:predicted alpha/beta superfamily hydrolase
VCLRRLRAQDGENVFNDSTSFGGRSWRAAPTLDALITQGRMREVVVVAVDNTQQRIDEYTYSADPQYGGGDADIYLDFLEDIVLPLVRAKFPRLASLASSPPAATTTAAAAAAPPPTPAAAAGPSQQQRGTGTGGAAGPRLGIVGSSLGGLLSCYAAWSRPLVYSTAGCMSPSFWWNGQDFDGSGVMRRWPPPIPPRTGPSGSVLYLDVGSAESADMIGSMGKVHADMAGLGMRAGEDLFFYLDPGGQHSEAFWGNRLHIPMSVLYPPL